VTLESFFVLLKPLFGGTGVVLIIGGGGILALPRSWAEGLGLETLRNTSRSEFGLSLVIGIGIVVAVQLFDKQSILQRALQRWRDGVAKNALLAVNHEALEKLTPDEKAYLLPYIKNGKTMQRFKPDDGIAGALQARSIIFCGAREYDRFTGPEFALTTWARDYLTKHPDLLDGASSIKPNERFRTI
jgi:hypothetical protein